jgi:tetratricopeptide (TPR) repeat protein
VHVNMTDPPKDDKHRKRPYPNRVDLTADVVCNYQRIYRRNCSQYVSTDYEYRPDWEEAAEGIAEDVMRDLTPHQVRYSETVDEVETNPAVEQAARACAAGNWEGGRSLARQALAQNPNEAEAYYVLGLIERNARNYTASDAHFRKAHSLNPQGKYLSAIHDNSRLQQDEQRARQQMQ